MAAAAGVVAGLIVLGCAGGDVDALAELRKVAAVEQGVPVLVFVYTDG